MSEKRWLYFALGVTTVISIGAVTNQLVPVVPAGMAIGDAGITFPDGTVQTTAGAGAKKYYLTDAETYEGDEVIGACGMGTGFHTASLWEIADPSSLEYAFSHPNAYTRSDSGNGPPTESPGWIRTGSGVGTSQVGRANCLDWLVGNNYEGTLVKLSEVWDNPAADGSALVWGTPWAAKAVDCGESHRVWCVED